MLAEKRLAKGARSAAVRGASGSMLETLECRTLLSAHFPLGGPAVSDANPFADSTHLLDRSADSAFAPTGFSIGDVAGGPLTTPRETQPFFNAVPNVIPNVIPLIGDQNDSSRVYAVSMNDQYFQGNNNATGDAPSSNPSGWTGGIGFGGSGFLSNFSPIAPVIPVTNVPPVMIVQSPGDSSWNVNSRNIGSPSSNPITTSRTPSEPPAGMAAMGRIAPASAPVAPSSGVVMSAPGTSAAVAPAPTAPAQAVMPLAIRSANNPVLETRLAIDPPMDRAAADPPLPAAMGTNAASSMQTLSKSPTLDEPTSTVLAAAAKIAPEISLAIAYRQTVWGLGEGLSSVGASAGMIETILIADASALARVANSAADRIGLEEAMVWKEMAAFLGGGILIGTYAVRSRQSEEITARQSIRRKNLCVDEIPR